MGSRYVPPALRRQSQSSGDNATPTWKTRQPSVDDSNLVSPDEIKNHFWPAAATEGSFGSESGSKTLHDSAATPGKLSYLFLFHSANPRWEGEHLVFTKSTLELLPPATRAEVSRQRADESGQRADESHDKPRDGDPEPSGAAEHNTVSIRDPETAETSKENGMNQSDPDAAKEDDAGPPSPQQVHNGNPDAPVAVFKQVHPRQNARSFAFEGWFRISNIAYLEPRSTELVRMLEQKWTHVDRHGKVVKRVRNEGQWQASLGLRWAVVKFAKHEEAERERGPPKIERLADPEEGHGEGRKDSVNELLAKMRLQDEAEASVTAV